MKHPNQMAVPDEGQGAPLAMTTENIPIILSYPLMVLPSSVRPAMMRCWLGHTTIQGLQKNCLPLAIPMSVWINEDGLKPEDAVVILARQVNLSHFGNYEFASQFVNAIGEQCKTALAARKRQDEEKARLAEQQATAGKRATPEELAAFRAGIAKFGIGEIASSP